MSKKLSAPYRMIIMIIFSLLIILSFSLQTSIADASPKIIRSAALETLPHEILEKASPGKAFRDRSYEDMELGGDINGDRSLSLADLILSLRISCGLPSSGIRSDYQAADLNADDRIGLEEVVYLLQVISSYPTHNDTVTALLRDELPMERAVNVPSEHLTDMNAAVAYLTDNLANDYERVKVLHDWIALNIAYDVESFFAGEYPPMDAESVFSRRTAVCEGYANLFSRFCEIAGTECVKIIGLSKGYGYSSAGTLGGHAWNGVRIDNEWYLIDTTWDSGGLSSETNTFVFDYDVEYLFIDPRAFIYDHFPNESEWQLLNPPISQDQFEALPYIDQYIFLLGVRFFDPVLLYPYHYSHMADGETDICLSAPENVDVWVSIRDSEGNYLDRDGLVFSQRENAIFRSRVKFPETGDYTLRISAERTTDDDALIRGKMEYDVRSNKGAAKFFPTFHSSFHESGIELVESEYAREVENEFRVSLRASEDAKLSVGIFDSNSEYVDEKGLVLYESEGDLHELSVKFPAQGDYAVTIYNKEIGDGYTTTRRVLEYQIRANKGTDKFFPTFHMFYEGEIELVEPEYSREVESEFRISLRASEEVKLSAGIKDSNSESLDDERLVSYQSAGDLHEFSVKFPEQGDYTVIIYKEKAGEGYTMTVPVLDYQIHVNTGSAP